MEELLKNYSENKRIVKSNNSTIKKLNELVGEASTSCFSGMPIPKRICKLHIRK